METDIGTLTAEFVKAGGWGIMIFLILTGNLFTKSHVTDLKSQITQLTTTLNESSHAMDRMADAWEARNKAEGDK